MIRLQNLTKRFSNGKGIFDLTFRVKQGEVFGYLGPNGAGKSTTIRHLMGFMKPTSGTAQIHDLDCWKNAAKIQKQVGYLPGEIALMEGLNGKEILELIARMRGLQDTSRRDALIERFQLDIQVPIRKMSKGMKQKVGIILAFMHDPAILILDEPTSGLDPLMQRVFIDLILEEKSRGKTILMSSHQFPEIERTCDRVGIIKEGRLVTVSEMTELLKVQRKVFIITLGNTQDIDHLKQAGFEVISQTERSIELVVQGDYNRFLQTLAVIDVQQVDIRNLDLQEVFMHYYEK